MSDWSRRVLVAGLPRGGTTWVGAMLAEADEASYLFEPFSVKHHPPTSVSAELGFRDPAPFGGGGDPRTLRTHFDEVLGGALPDGGDTLVVKQPETERLELLVEVVAPDVVIHVGRDPVPVVNSHLNSGLYEAWGMGARWRALLDVADTLVPDVAPTIRAAEGPAQEIAAINVARLVLRPSICPPGSILLDYTDLATAPLASFEQLWRDLGWTWSDQVAARIRARTTPTATESGPLSVTKSSSARLVGWRRELAPWVTRRLYRYLAPVDDRLGVAVDRRPLRASESAAGAVGSARRWAGRLRRRSRVA